MQPHGLRACPVFIPGENYQSVMSRFSTEPASRRSRFPSHPLCAVSEMEEPPFECEVVESHSEPDHSH